MRYSSRVRLLIVESPAKAKKLQGYADELYGVGTLKVVATVGHWRGLPKMDGQPFSDVVDTGSWQERFVVHKDDIAAKLGSHISKATEVILATDADREGEAIAWHIAQHFRLHDPKRATYTEVTKAALSAALAAPRPLDLPLIEAQRARQVLDYLLGMELSRRLWRFGCKSAGRVQSAALRIVVDREKAIEDFKAVPYWTVQATYGEGFSAVVATFGESTAEEDAAQADESFGADDAEAPGKKEPVLRERRFATQEEAAEVVKAGKAVRHTIEKVDAKTELRKPPAPFSTASMQAAAAEAFDWRPDKTAAVAQSLYEAGLVSYIRTDSVSLGTDAIADVRAYLQKHHPKALPAEPQRHADSKGAQGAHEAIRPTSMDNPEAASLRGDDRTLYDLIFRRTLVSQAKSAEFHLTTVTVAPAGLPWRLLKRGSALVSPGYLALLNDAAAPASDLPTGLVAGQPLALASLLAKGQKTKAPSRFTLKSLIAYLERKGIGRPSSYGTIFATLEDRNYLRRAKKFIVPDELGVLCDRLTRTSFDVLTQEQFTAVTERGLDAISEKKQQRTVFLTSFFGGFSKMLTSADQALAAYAERHPELDRKAVIPHKDPCPACGAACVVRKGKFGTYAQCNDESCGRRRSLEQLKRLKEPCPTCDGEVIEQPYVADGKRSVFYRCENGDWKSSFKPPKVTKVPCHQDSSHGMMVEVVRVNRTTKEKFTRYVCQTCDYSAKTKEPPPACPLCRVSMNFITPKTGDPFWGCSEFAATGCKGFVRPAPPKAAAAKTAKPSARKLA